MVWSQECFCCLYFEKKRNPGLHIYQWWHDTDLKSTKRKKKALCSCLNILVGLTGLWWRTGQGWRFQTPPSCPSPPRGDRPVGRRLWSPACSPGRNAERVEMASGGNNLRKQQKKKVILYRLSGMLHSVNCHIYASFIKYRSSAQCTQRNVTQNANSQILLKGI